MGNYRKERAEARKKAKELVSKMTLMEKAAQLRYDAAPVSRLGVPTYNYWNEALHGVARAGVATMFPQAIGMAAAFDEDAMERVGDIIATEGRAKYNEYSKHDDRDIYKGLTFWSPNVNIFRDPRWGRGHETYGEDPYLTSRLGVRFVEGIQGGGPVMKAAACAKHYAVHSGPEAIRHEFDAEVSMKDMWETYLPAFEALVKEADVEAVMGAYNRTNGEPCCGHKYLMEEVLRGKWEFDGHYTSDCWAIKDFHENHQVTKNARESAALALKCGCDVNCGNTYLHLLGAVEDGLITEEDITVAAERLLTSRFLMGLFDGSEYDDIPYEAVECREHLEEALNMARKGSVLLKNDGVLPLDKSKLKTIGVVGPNADSRAALIGNYHGTASRYITVLEGIQDEVGDDVRVLFSEGCHLEKDRVENLAWSQDRISEAVITAEHSDVVIICVGLDETLEGEEGDAGNSDASGDKKDLHLPKVQEELIEKVTAVGKPTEYKMNFDYWEVLNPYDENATMNTEVMFELFGELCGLAFDTPVKVEEGTDTGIADSDMGYTVEYVDTADDSKAQSTEDADTAAEVILGNEDGSGGRYAAVAGSEDQVYVLPEETLRMVFGRKPFDYILKIPVLISADTLKGIVVTAEDRQYEIQVDTAADSYKFGRKKVDKNEFAALYQAISGIILDSEIDGERDGEKEEPKLTVVFDRNMEDAPKVQVSYYSYDDEFDSVEIDGEERFLVKKEEVEALIGQIEEAF